LRFGNKKSIGIWEQEEEENGKQIETAQQGKNLKM